MLDEHLKQQKRWLRFDDRDLSLGADAAILAMDGKLCRADALMIARSVFESKGMEKARG